MPELLALSGGGGAAYFGRLRPAVAPDRHLAVRRGGEVVASLGPDGTDETPVVFVHSRARCASDEVVGSRRPRRVPSRSGTSTQIQC